MSGQLGDEIPESADAHADAEVIVLVLNWNGEEDTVACVESLRAQRGVRLRILLIDNASADGSGERLHARYPEIDYLQTGSNRGYSGGNNAGLEWACGQSAQWIMVLNNDTVASPDCVAQLMDAAKSHPDVAALAPMIVLHENPAVIWFGGGKLSRLRGAGLHEREGERVENIGAWASERGLIECTFLTGCCMFLRREALVQVGFFRQDFFAYVEDAELSLRFQQAGWSIGWVPSARLAHRSPPTTTAPSAWQIRLRDRNRRRMVRDRFSLREALLFHAWFWPTRLLLLLRFLIRGDSTRAGAVLAGMFDS